MPPIYLTEERLSDLSERAEKKYKELLIKRDDYETTKKRARYCKKLEKLKDEELLRIVPVEDRSFVDDVMSAMSRIEGKSYTELLIQYIGWHIRMPQSEK